MKRLVTPATLIEALDNERRHRHGDGRHDVLEQVGVRLERRYSSDEQRAGTEAVWRIL